MKFIALKPHFKEQEKSQIYNLTLHQKKLEKEEHEVERRKQDQNGNKTDTQKKIEKIKQRAVSLKRQAKLTKLEGKTSKGDQLDGDRWKIYLIKKKKTFGYTAQPVSSQFPHQGLNSGPRQWKHQVLTTEPPGNSLK